MERSCFRVYLLNIDRRVCEIAWDLGENKWGVLESELWVRDRWERGDMAGKILWRQE